MSLLLKLVKKVKKLLVMESLGTSGSQGASPVEGDLREGAAESLQDKEHRDEMLEGANELEAAAIQVWMACGEARGETDGKKRTRFMQTMKDTFFAINSPACLALPEPVVTAFRESIDALTKGQVVNVDALNAIELAALGFLIQSGIVERRTMTPAKIRSAREWVLGPEKGSVDSEKELSKLHAAHAAMKNDLGEENTPVEQLHGWFKILLSMLIVYEEPVEGELDEVCARLEKADPLSGEMLRRKALMVSFVRTHKRTLPSDRLAKLVKTMSTFSFEDEEMTQRKFTNAIEAFAQGRNHNKHQKSSADLKDVIRSVKLFDPLKQSDPVMRKQLLDAEHAFEAAYVMMPSNHKLMWNWALHYWWVADFCELKRPAATGRFLLACASKCLEALKLRASHYKPLLLWSQIIERVAIHAVKLAVTESEYMATLDQYTQALERYCVRRPFEFDLAPLRQLAELSGDCFSATTRKIVSGCLRNLTASGVVRKLCLTAAEMWLSLAEKGTLDSRALKSLLSEVGISIQDAQEHLEPFIAVVHSEFARKARRHHGVVAESATAGGNENLHQHGKRKQSMWTPNFDAEVEKVIRTEDPKRSYAFLGKLGQGGFGTVYEGRRKSDKCPVAIKENLRPFGSHKAEVLAEIRVMQMCRSKNIVHFMDAFAHQDRVYIMMLYCDGGSLEKVISKMALREHIISHIFRAVLGGLDYMERMCLVHRDIKPANILLSRNGVIRIGDLGLVKPQVECQFQHSRAGTPLFRAPEVLLGHGATTKSDMYSFGCSVYNSFYSQPPRANLKPNVLMWKTTTEAGVPEFHGEYRGSLPSSHLVTLMESCFELDPLKRWAAFNALKSPFFEHTSPTIASEMAEVCDIAFLDEALEIFGM